MKIIMMIGALFLLVLTFRALSREGGADVSVDAADLTEGSVRELLLRGRKIQAIKAYRELHRVDLRAAKEAVERLAQDLPLSR